MYSLSDDLEVRVSPCPPAGPFRVAVCNVHATHKTDFAVYDHDLPVVPVVYFAGEDWKRHFQESMDFDAGIRHFLEELVFHVPAAHIVVKDTDFYSFFGFLDQQFFDLVSDLVVAEDVILDVNMMGCFGNLLQKVVKLVCPVRIDRDVASVEQGRLVAVCQQCDQWLVGGRNGTGILWEFPFLRPLHDTLIGASGDNPLLPVILPEEEIEQEPDTGGE